MRTRFAAIFAVLLVACSSSGSPVATSAGSSPTPTTPVPPTTRGAPTEGAPTPTPSAPAQTAPPSPTPITDPSQAFRPLASGWRPAGVTLVIARSTTSGDTTLVALPLGAGGRVDAPVPIVSFGPGAWDLRADGGAVAVAAWTGRGARIAVWDVRLAAARWLTPDEPGTNDFSPVWSKDGAFVYYSSSSGDGRTAGLFRIGADGLGKKAIPTGERFGGPQGLTPDGKGLVWSLGQAGGSVEILDLTTGVNRHIENNARVASWRARQPRLLLKVGGCCAGGPGGSLVVWDDVALTSRVVAEIGQYGDPAWGIGAWDPTGTRIAAARYEGTSPGDASLAIIDVENGSTHPAAAPRGIAYINWIPEGILFTVRQARQPGEELMLLPAQGTAVSLLKESNGITRIDVIRP